MNMIIRPNILLLSALGVALIALLGYLFPVNGDLVIGLGGVLLGGFVGAMKELADDRPPAKPDGGCGECKCKGEK